MSSAKEAFDAWWANIPEFEGALKGDKIISASPSGAERAFLAGWCAHRSSVAPQGTKVEGHSDVADSGLPNLPSGRASPSDVTANDTSAKPVAETEESRQVAALVKAMQERDAQQDCNHDREPSPRCLHCGAEWELPRCQTPEGHQRLSDDMATAVANEVAAKLMHASKGCAHSWGHYRGDFNETCRLCGAEQRAACEVSAGGKDE